MDLNDLKRFINSKDVADYLEEIDFQPNAAQAAYLVYNSDDTTIEDRIEAWQNIIETMPDCSFDSTINSFLETSESVHDALREHIEKVKTDLKNFESLSSDGDPYVFIPVRSRFDELPEWLNKPTYVRAYWNKAIQPMPFTTYEGCFEYLQQETKKTLGDYPGGPMLPKHVGSYDRHVIGKTRLNLPGNCFDHYYGPEPGNYYLQRIMLNGDFQPISVCMDWYGNMFTNMVPYIPHPFKKGDIVIDARRDNSQPFVFDTTVTWELGEETKWGRELDTERFEAELAKKSHTIGVLYYAEGQMFAYGYKLNSPRNYAEGLLSYPWSGAAHNYLDLRYYSVEDEGSKESRILEYVARYLRNRDALHQKFDDPYDFWEALYSDDHHRNDVDTGDMEICDLVNAAFRLK